MRVYTSDKHLHAAVTVRVSLTRVQPLAGDAESLGEGAGSQLLLDVAHAPGLVRVALLRHADEQDVVLGGPHLPLFQPGFARRALGREEPSDRAPPAERVAARHGHRLGHEEEAQRTLQQIHGEDGMRLCRAEYGEETQLRGDVDSCIRSSTSGGRARTI